MRPPSAAAGALRAFMPSPATAEQAAEALGVSATAVSHQIKLLESVLECRVCERSAQGVSLTADGEILYAATNAPLAPGTGRRPDRSCPSAAILNRHHHLQFLTHWLVPRLDFTARFPAIDLRLHQRRTSGSASGHGRRRDSLS